MIKAFAVEGVKNRKTKGEILIKIENIPKQKKEKRVTFFKRHLHHCKYLVSHCETLNFQTYMPPSLSGRLRNLKIVITRIIKIFAISL